MSEFAGTLRHRIVIERTTTTRTPTGLQNGGWEPVARCLAAIELDGVGPEAEAQALSAMPRLRVTIRRWPGVSVGQRVRWKDRAMIVRQMLDDPARPDRLVLRCEELRS